MDKKELILIQFTINYKNLPWTSYDTSFVIFNSDGVQLSNLLLGKWLNRN